MRVLGITGGVGTGKSRVLQYLQEEKQAHICQLDTVARELEKNGAQCFDQIVATFGKEILDGQGELDREKLSEMVFDDPEKLSSLNQIVHPEVKQEVIREIAEEEGQGTSLFVIEAALLPGAGYEDLCQEIWYIYAKESVRRQRLKESRCYTEERITKMIMSQPSDQEYRDFSDRVIENSRSFAETEKQIGEAL